MRAAVGLIVALTIGAPALAAPGGAGTLLDATPVAGAPLGASAFRIRYGTLDTQNKPIVVTGLVVVPRGKAPRGGRNLIGWAHGSFGIAEKCGPLPDAQLFNNIAGLKAMLEQGYVVAATDYQGLGNPGPHPYLVGNASARAVIDAVRAARALPGADGGKHYAVWGESQGAHAALWVGKLSRRYAPELTLVGIAAAAPPSDLKANLTGGSNAAVRAMLTAYTAESWSQVYHAPLSDLGRPATQRLIGRLANNNCITLDGFRLRTKIGLLALTAQLRGVDISRPPAWSALITRNSLTPARLTMPLFIAQEDKDPVVGATVTHRFAKQLCKAGAKLEYLKLSDGNHVDVGKRSAPRAVAWMADRFHGKAAPTNCAKV